MAKRGSCVALPPLLTATSGPRVGLAVAKARDTVLGNPRLREMRPSDTKAATAARSAAARARYADLAVIVDALEAEAGRRLSLRELTVRLNDAGCMGPRGGPLTTTHVVRIRQAAAAAQERATAESDTERCFRTRAGRGDTVRGLAIVDELDRHHEKRR